ncbi:MAG: SusC/RagA family TonB-linked outer membrane protein [Balneolales bacterium]
MASGTPNADNETEWMNRMNLYAVEQEGYLEGREIDWFNETMPGGMQQEADVSISGGSDIAQYYWSIGYIDNEGMVAGDQFSALRTRLNLDFQITDWLSAGTNLQYSDRDESAVPASLSNMYEVSPFGRMYSEDGSLEWWPGEQRTATNPLINTLGQDRSRKLSSLFGSLYAEVTLPFGISHEVSFQPRISNTRELNYWSPETLTGGNSYSNGRATRYNYESFEWMLDNILKWNGDYGAHSFDVTLLHSAEKSQSWQNELSNNTFQPSPNLGYSGLNYGTNPAFDVNDTQVTGDAMMARLNYGLMDKYLFTASIRRDGYSAFGQENPRATFPALAFAWKINEESFFNVDMVDELKLRLSWGVNGNRDIGAYSSLARLGSNRYSNGSAIRMGVFTNSLSNPGLMWEETESYNVGLDMAFIENRINLSLDYYDMTTSNLLVDRTLPISTGFTSITDNIGELANRGFEMTLHTNNITTSDFNWRSSLNFSLNRNEITQLFGDTGTYTLVGEEYEGELPDYSNEWFPGRAVDVIWDYERTGIWQEEEVDAAAEYNQIPGDIKARDLNGNQLYEEDYDKQFIGHTEPRYRIGLRNEVDFLGNFSASVFVRADLGHKARFAGPGIGGSSTHERENLEPYPYWTLENRSNEYPSLHHNPNDFAGGLTFWRDASFVRIQDLSLSYSLPQSLAQRVQMQNVRIFGSVRNLATFSDWPGWDPESLNSPMPRTFSLGLNVSL